MGSKPCLKYDRCKLDSTSVPKNGQSGFSLDKNSNTNLQEKRSPRDFFCTAGMVRKQIAERNNEKASQFSRQPGKTSTDFGTGSTQLSSQTSLTRVRHWHLEKEIETLVKMYQNVYADLGSVQRQQQVRVKITYMPSEQVWYRKQSNLCATNFLGLRRGRLLKELGV